MKTYKLHSLFYTYSIFLTLLFSISFNSYAGITLTEQITSTIPKNILKKLEKLKARGPVIDAFAAELEASKKEQTMTVRFLEGSEYSYELPTNLSAKGSKLKSESYSGEFGLFTSAKKNGKLRGTFFIGERQFHFRQFQGYAIVLEVDLSSMKTKNDIFSAPLNCEILGDCPNLSNLFSPEMDVTALSGNSSSTIRILFAYANEARTYFDGQGINRTTLAQDMVDDLNDYFITSEVDSTVQVELAGVFDWDYDDSNWGKNGFASQGPRPLNWDSMLSRASAWSRNPLYNRRNIVNADIVAVIVDDVAYQYCGMAKGIFPGNSDAYFGVQVDCTNNGITTAHEFGHILGMRHNIEEDSSSTPYVYGHGLLDTAVQRLSIMSYQCNGGSSWCGYKQGLFSNPDINWPNVTPARVAGSIANENNAQVLRNKASIVAGYK